MCCIDFCSLHQRACRLAFLKNCCVDLQVAPLGVGLIKTTEHQNNIMRDLPAIYLFFIPFMLTYGYKQTASVRKEAEEQFDAIT